MKFTCRFFTERSRDGRMCRVRYRVRWNCLQVRLDTGQLVEPDKWSADAQRCKRNSSHGRKRIAAAHINRELDAMESAVQSVFDHFDSLNVIPDVAQFRLQYDVAIGKRTDEVTTIDAYFGKFLEEGIKESRWAEGTIKKLTTIRGRLSEFSPTARLSDIDEKFVSDFITFMLKVGYSNSSVKKNLAVARWFVKWCSDNGHCEFPQALNRRPAVRVARREVVFLTWEELMRVYNAELPQPYQRRVRDVFCFQCFTSLRHSDVANLKRSAVFSDHIAVTTIKTGDLVHIELNKYSRAILDRYKTDKFDRNLALPVISGQKMNKYLKEVMRLCGIDTPITIVTYRGNRREEKVYPKWQLITSHCGRRTFICNALMLGIPAEIVMKWTGHSSYASMRPYIAVADDAKKRAMRLFDKMDVG
ncbi:MAG: phage integrase SAM-like domain-containing protein [Muribaculaceae bacterium]|nr:phage integrase SAM-like domain-containing protein [Muribaculaceae bacterium]